MEDDTNYISALLTFRVLKKQFRLLLFGEINFICITIPYFVPSLISVFYPMAHFQAFSLAFARFLRKLTIVGEEGEIDSPYTEIQIQS